MYGLILGRFERHMLEMAWTFVGRVEQLETLRRAVCSGSPGPIMITGEPGMGRSTLLVRALAFTDPERDMVARLEPVEPAEKRPFAALRTGFPGALPSSATRAEVGRAIADGAAGRRVVMAVDDGHLMDLESLLVMRDLSRSGAALLLITCPPFVGARSRPDPTDSLRYEKGIQLLKLQPLTVGEVAAVLADALNGPVALPTAEAIHAATGGNPRDLEALAGHPELTALMVRRDGQWRLGPNAGAATREPGGRRPDLTQVVAATWKAWRELASERTDQLSRLALWHGVRDGIGPIWAMLLLLRGCAAEALAFIDSLGGESVATAPRLSLVRAMTLAVGLGRVEEASEFLAHVADQTDYRDLIFAHRAWVLAVTGRASQASATLGAIRRSDLETATFVHATRGVLTRIADNPAEAVFHFRRALATAESGSVECPWMRPFLKACLIDSLLLSGRVQDAASVARRFHAEARGSGWEFAVALDTLMRQAGQTGDDAGRLRVDTA